MIKAILTLNAGSSSIKFAVYQLHDLSMLCRGQMSSIHASSQALFETELKGKKTTIILSSNIDTHQQALDAILQWLEESEFGWELVAAGHRVVHGGAKRSEPVLIDYDLMQELKALEPLAPLHQVHNLAAIDSVLKTKPKLPQVACFDTAFHALQNLVQRLIPLPKKYRDKGLMRYGFHGLSYEYLLNELTQITNNNLPNKLIIAHVGNGASACAINKGQSVASTMAFSTLDGLLMGTRCGSIDAGILLYLMQTEGLTVDELATCLYQQSGLLGLSGESSDVRELETSNTEPAKQALEYYIDSIVKNIVSLTSTLEGFDALVFSGGVGENSVFIREKVLTKLKWLGVDINHSANQQHELEISTKNSRVQCYVIKTDEELVIAQHTKQKYQGVILGLD